jgi:hypothetical protein
VVVLFSGVDVPGKLVDHFPSGDVNGVHTPAGGGSGVPDASETAEAVGNGVGDAIGVAVGVGVGVGVAMATGDGLGPAGELFCATTKRPPAAISNPTPRRPRAIGSIAFLAGAGCAVGVQAARLSKPQLLHRE